MMVRTVSAVAGAFLVTVVPTDRLIPASTALMPSLFVGGSRPAMRCI
jgi:hypothetical protein